MMLVLVLRCGGLDDDFSALACRNRQLSAELGWRDIKRNLELCLI